MNSIMIKSGFAYLILILMTLTLLVSCSSSPTRTIAQEHKSDVSKIQEGQSAPHEFHGKRFDKYQEY